MQQRINILTIYKDNKINNLVSVSFLLAFRPEFNFGLLNLIYSASIFTSWLMLLDLLQEIICSCFRLSCDGGKLDQKE